MATYSEAEDLINIGAYKPGSNKNIDFAISKIDAVNEFLLQETDEKFDFENEIAMLFEMFPLPEEPKPAAKEIPLAEPEFEEEPKEEVTAEEEEPDVSALLADQDSSDGLE